MKIDKPDNTSATALEVKPVNMIYGVITLNTSLTSRARRDVKLDIKTMLRLREGPLKKSQGY